MTPGRSCPLAYRYASTDLARPATIDCETLYVAGGVYGNRPALRRINALFEAEPGPKRLVFNGDFHWFDTDPDAYREVAATVLGHDALRGNVETELAADAAGASADAGCGCGYPAWVDDATVAHSNAILQRLRATARRQPEPTRSAAGLPMTLRADVAGVRVAIVHGDATSLAGWGFAQELLADPAHVRTVAGWFDAAQVDIFASSHTCLPVFQRIGNGLVLNNGAAGMANFAGRHEGLLTRISTRPFDGPQARFGLRRGLLFIDAIAVDFDAGEWQAEFLAQWPPGSPAHASYWRRIVEGPSHTMAQALRLD